MMAAATLTVLTVFVLLGSVSCQGGYRGGYPATAPPPPAHAPITSQPPSYPPTTPQPPTYSSTSPSSPPHMPPPPSPPSTPQPSVYPSTTSQPPSYPPTTAQPPTYPRTSLSPPPSMPSPPPPPSTPQPSAYPPTTSQPPTYSSTSPSPPPSMLLPPPPPSTPQPSAYPPTTSQPPSYPPTTAQPPTYPPTSLSPSPHMPSHPPSTPQPSTYPPTTSQPPFYPPTIPQPPTYPPAIPSSPPPILSPPPSSNDPGKDLMVGYYKNKCGPYVDVEAIVRKHVNDFDAGMKAGLIRLFFHDCFIRGCDASILLDPTSDNQQPEKLGIPNFPSLRSYEVIDAAKAEVEAKCPGTVSCADIVAFAARDASYFLSGGGVNFDMPAGRYDGNVSLASETLPNLPPPFAGFQQLVKMFADKGLNTFDMVTLSGAHSIGRSHCSSFSHDRLPPSNTLDMDPTFAAKLQAKCTSKNGTDNTVIQDYETPDELDNQYYQNVLDLKVLFTSDAALTSNDMTNNLVRVYTIFPWFWQQQFEEAMVKMGRIEIKTAATGEIRKTCRVVNI